MLERKRILVCEFHQESNTFNPKIEKFERFVTSDIYEGKEAYEQLKTRPIMVHGMFDAIEEAQGEVIPSIFLHADSGGRVDDAVLELMIERTRYYIENAGEFSAVCVALHGATCTVSEDDACGFFLEKVRELVGDKPIAAGFDLHANITRRILKYADIICGYQTYPHVDFYETGYRVGKLCMQMLDKKIVRKAAAIMPILVPPSGYTSKEGAFKEIHDAGRAFVREGSLLDYTIFPVQPWLDIKEINSVVVTIGEDDEIVKEKADEMACMLYERRQEYLPELMSVEEVIDIAEANTTGKPIVLSDAADSPNGGAVGDSPVIAMRIKERGSKIRAGMFIVDPEAVKTAFEIGVGNSCEFAIGAGYTPGMPGPFKGVGVVKSLHDGSFRAEGPANRGVPGTMGMCAVINFENIDILVTETCTHSGDPQVFRHFGIEPTMYDLIVVKANTSFREAYSKFAAQICYADTPGAGAANLERFSWKHVSKQMYMFTK